MNDYIAGRAGGYAFLHNETRISIIFTFSICAGDAGFQLHCFYEKKLTKYPFRIRLGFIIGIRHVTLALLGNVAFINTFIV